jgi:DNA invertase Pin-like site-specific DNA recombinase
MLEPLAAPFLLLRKGAKMTNTNRLNAIYARQSVDKKDSISIESQIEFCRHELRGGAAREYQDKGFSGKNTDRPQFQQLVKDIEAGLIARVVVYKLDRISRSILDFANMMALFQKNNVEFVSSTEKFDTSTPMGRAMLNICIVFAQLERETIQRRVADNYHSRTRKGFRAGKVPYGYMLEPFSIQGKATKRLAANPETSDNIRLMFEMYADPQISLGDVTRHFCEQDILVNGKSLFKTNLSEILRNPVYVQADIDIYDFFKDNGADIDGDASDFTGVTGCCLFRKKDCQHDNSRYGLQDKVLVPSPHEGIIPSDLWLKVRRKLMANPKYQAARKPVQTWLAGKIKCGNCGYALMSVRSVADMRYLRCSKRAENKSCVGCKGVKTGDIEQLVYNGMVEKLQGFNGAPGNSNHNNPKLTAAKVELAQVNGEIERLVESLMGANATLLSFANRRAEELDTRKQALMLEIAELSTAEIPANKIAEISAFLADWENTSLEDKRQVVDSVVSVIRATSNNVTIEWKI